MGLRQLKYLFQTLRHKSHTKIQGYIFIPGLPPPVRFRSWFEFSALIQVAQPSYYLMLGFRAQERGAGPGFYQRLF